MKQSLILLSLVGLFFLAACGGSGDKPTGNNKAKIASDLGKKIYKTRCVICHGIDGKLGANGSKDITVSALTKAERITLIKNGKGAMTPFKGILSDEEIEAVTKYTFKL